MTVHQPSLFDGYDATGTPLSPLAAYDDRHYRGALIPGEQCPACGHTFPQRYDATHDHGIFSVEPLVCFGMDLTRRHLAIDLRDDRPEQAPYREAQLERDVRHARAAGWPAATVDAWLADPHSLYRAAGFREVAPSTI